jgi:uncharacterized protein (TIGR03067 family)
MRLLALVAAGLLAGSVMGAPVPKAKQAADEEAIRGTWEVVGIEVGGNQKIDPPFDGERWVFGKGGKLTTTVGGKVQTEQTYTLDPAAKPKALDMTGDLSGVSQCLYELDGGKLRVCFQWSVKDGGKPVRPDQVKADGQKRIMIVTLKRVTDENKDK